jgi:hypothetical protein
MNTLTAYPTELVDEVTLLPDIPQAELNANGLFVVQGLTVPLAEQLVERSKEAPVRDMCKNDADKRFKDVNAVAKWQTKERLSLPLVREAGRGSLELMGFGWIGPGVPGEDEPYIPGATTTFAVRIYEGATGQGNARPYTEAIVAAHDKQFGSEGVWLEAWGDNQKALRPYEQAGFVEVARVMGERHGQSRERVYMILGDISTQAA